MKQIGSATIISAGATSTEIGTRLGERGLATQDATRVAAWLARQRPADMDAAAVSRASSHGVTLKVRYELRFPSGPNGEILPFYAVAVGCAVDGANTSAALADLRNFMTPAPVREIEGWLAELSVIAPKRQDDEFTEELRVTAYASRLARYPADVVREVLLGRSHRFFPSWFELEKLCESATGPRRQMIAALERGPDPVEPARRPPTDEEKERIKTLVDEIFPMRSQEMRDAAIAEMTKGDCMRAEP